MPAEKIELAASDVDREAVDRKFYFANEVVEWKLVQYRWTGCTSIELRDSIMLHADELIRQNLRTQGLAKICRDEFSFDDLRQVAWMQIERTLFKFRAVPHCRACYRPRHSAASILHELGDREFTIPTTTDVIRKHRSRCPYCNSWLASSGKIEPQQGRYGGTEAILYRGTSKVFNMWSSVSRTVSLAYLKKNSRDNRYQSRVEERLNHSNSKPDVQFDRFIREAHELFKYDDEALLFVDTLHRLLLEQSISFVNSIGTTLSRETGYSTKRVQRFLHMLRLRSLEFSDSPMTIGSRGVPAERESD